MTVAAIRMSPSNAQRLLALSFIGRIWQLHPVCDGIGYGGQPAHARDVIGVGGE